MSGRLVEPPTTTSVGQVTDPSATDPPADAPPAPSLVAPSRVLLAIVAAGIAGIAVAITRRAGGFGYTLDDPYIHLRVAQQIARGHYGMNPGEASAPASSPLWPFLLAPVARWSLVVWMPLALAAASTLASTQLVFATIRRGWRSLDPSGWRTAVLAGAVVVLSGTLAVTFTGMEHSLQIALTLAILLGVGRVADGEAPARWLWAAMVVLPLVRYEGLAVSMVAAAALLLLGERRRPLLTVAACIAGLVAFSGFLLALGLSPVPSSVLVKANLAGSRSGVGGFVRTTGENWSWAMDLGDLSVIALAAAAALLAIALAAGARTLRREITLLGISVVLLAAHISVFSHEGFLRYQLYAITAAMTAIAGSLPAVTRAARASVPPSTLRSGFLGAVLVLVAASLINGGTGLFFLVGAAAAIAIPLFTACVRPLGRGGVLGVALVLIAVTGSPTISRTVHVASDAAATRNQQFAMHRFADQLGQPVAANDIGWVTYDADVPVLDLWGLASPAAREARQEAAPGWMEDLMEAEGVEVAMIYDSWFEGQIPPAWIEVATLRTTPSGMLGGEAVTFYARTGATAADARAALASIQPGLTDESRLTFR